MKETRVPEPVVDKILSAMEYYSFLRNFCSVSNRFAGLF